MANGPSKTRGVASIFQRGVTLCQNESTHQIVMSFSPPVVACLLKKWLTKGEGHRHPRTPLATPLKTTDLAKFSFNFMGLTFYFSGYVRLTVSIYPPSCLGISIFCKAKKVSQCLFITVESERRTLSVKRL